MLYDKTLRDAPRPVWGFDWNHDAETLAYICISMGEWNSETKFYENVEESRSFQALCHEMAKHFCMTHDPDDPERWETEDWVNAIEGYIVSVQKKLTQYPDWLNDEHCSMCGKGTVLDLLAMPDPEPPLKTYTAQVFLVMSSTVKARDEKEAATLIEQAAQRLAEFSATDPACYGLGINEICNLESEEDE